MSSDTSEPTALKSPVNPTFDEATNFDATLSVIVCPGETHDVIAVAGEIDLATVPRLYEAMRTLLTQGRSHLVVDLDAVTFMDASALGFLVAAHQEATASGGSFALLCQNPQCMRLIVIAGLTGVFTFR